MLLETGLSGINFSVYRNVCLENNTHTSCRKKELTAVYTDIIFTDRI